ncbi:MAG: peptide deformylase [Cardiobacteriaceae bacterium]|nr:peptide deformylase [Cardiobacteriaceae bacterium]
MSLLELLIHPDRRLRKRAEEVHLFDENLAELTRQMFEVMYEKKGIGLAATQVNVHQRVVVIDIPEERQTEEEMSTQSASIPQPLVLINPKIIESSKTFAPYEEGCLSLPGQYAEVMRPDSIIYRYQDLQGNTHEAQATGLLCVCIQHEIDHLNGVLFIDHLSALKRERLEKKLAKSLKYS